MFSSFGFRFLPKASVRIESLPAVLVHFCLLLFKNIFAHFSYLTFRQKKLNQLVKSEDIKLFSSDYRALLSSKCIVQGSR